MDGFRYVFAVLTAMTLPPAIVYWLAVHPFVGFWRRLGGKISFTILGLGFLYVVYVCWLWRTSLVGRDLGTNWWLIVPGIALYLLAARMTRETARQLSFRTMLGVPEISPDRTPGRLLREGVYARVRHPRYASFLVGVVGIALIVNYAGLYVLAALSFPALHLVASLEERELRDRFGDEYDAYSATVPRLIPRLRRG